MPDYPRVLHRKNEDCDSILTNIPFSINNTSLKVNSKENNSFAICSSFLLIECNKPFVVFGKFLNFVIVNFSYHLVSPNPPYM